MVSLLFSAVTYAQAGPIWEHLIPNNRVLGKGTLRWFAFKVYDARLFAPVDWERTKRWDEVPLALELTYARAIKGGQIAQASADEIARLFPSDTGAQLAWSAAMRQLFPDVSEGDTLVGVYKPNQSIAFYHNDKPLRFARTNAGSSSKLGALADPAFGKAFFAIWLDERTRDRALRASLLGGFSGAGASESPAGASNGRTPSATN